ANIRNQENQWLVEVTNDEHNPEAFAHPSAHPQGRIGMLTPEQYQEYWGFYVHLFQTAVSPLQFNRMEVLC
ncbi:hypothetical protein OVW19_29470, partial [Klebsiella pneumoniae]|nr:hypothetical protein [Klebsiella pneumoniae]